MAELILIRHAQASFGAADYDALSETGHLQARLLGAHLAATGVAPERVVTGTMRRHRETLAGLGLDAPAAEEHPGLDEYDGRALLRATFGGEIPEDVARDRRTHFRALRAALAEWQRGGLAKAGEAWADFAARVAAARAHLCRPGARRVLAVTSGGPISLMLTTALDAPAARMIDLNLQVRNSAVSRFIFNERVFYLHGFNATPHLDLPERAAHLTYS